MQNLSIRGTSFVTALTAIVTALANVGNSLGRVFEDKKVSGGEYFDLILSATNIQVVIANLPDARKAWPVLEDAERAQIVSQFAAQFDLPNDQAEAKIEETLKQAEIIYTSGSKLYKAVRTVYVTWKPAKVVEVEPATDSPEVAPKGKK